MQRLSATKNRSVTPACSHVSQDRLWQRHMDLAAIGATDKGGVNRQALSAEEAEARRLIVSWARAVSFDCFTDAVGNLFLRLAGHDEHTAPVLTGSHIDSQPTGGKFDGSFGVLAGLEAITAITEAGLTPQRPIEVVAWMNEEGSRFAPGMMGSEAFVGARDVEAILTVRDAEGVSVAAALPLLLAATPELPQRALGRPISAFVEAHIEQGPILEREQVPIGVVTGIQGTRRFRVRVHGEAAHAGTVPRAQRRDALSAAVAMVAALEELMEDPEDRIRFTVGLFEIKPNAPSVVPSEVYFSIDFRHPEEAVLTRIGDQIEPLCKSLRGPCDVAVKEIARAQPLVFEPTVPESVRRASEATGWPQMDIYSAAGHDARQLHYHCPTGMIFVPCRDGISHNEAESAEPADLYAGTQVLTEVLLDLASR